jgi:ribosomal protein S18 acetylase RimI-like enzyme
VWLLAAAPRSLIGGDDTEPRSATGNIVGFVVLQDRDEDGAYESVAHIWTARGWRRQGIASRLLAHAREHYPIRYVEGPATEAGSKLIRARANELAEPGLADGNGGGELE